MQNNIKTVNVNNLNYDEALSAGGASSKASSRSSSRSSSPALSRTSSKNSRQSMRTIDALSQDPLFLVLTQFLSNSDSVNMVDALLEINKTLKDINQNLLKMNVN
jgi:hypothetical protein